MAHPRRDAQLLLNPILHQTDFTLIHFTVLLLLWILVVV